MRLLTKCCLAALVVVLGCAAPLGTDDEQKGTLEKYQRLPGLGGCSQTDTLPKIQSLPGMGCDDYAMMPSPSQPVAGQPVVRAPRGVPAVSFEWPNDNTVEISGSSNGEPFLLIYDFSGGLPAKLTLYYTGDDGETGEEVVAETDSSGVVTYTRSYSDSNVIADAFKQVLLRLVDHVVGMEMQQVDAVRHAMIGVIYARSEQWAHDVIATSLTDIHLTNCNDIMFYMMFADFIDVYAARLSEEHRIPGLKRALGLVAHCDG